MAALEKGVTLPVSALPVSDPAQRRDRLGWDQRVAVQEQNVAPRAGGFDAGIHGGGKTRIRGVTAQNDTPCRRQPVEP